MITAFSSLLVAQILQEETPRALLKKMPIFVYYYHTGLKRKEKKTLAAWVIYQFKQVKEK